MHAIILCPKVFLVTWNYFGEHRFTFVSTCLKDNKAWDMSFPCGIQMKEQTTKTIGKIIEFVCEKTIPFQREHVNVVFCIG